MHENDLAKIREIMEKMEARIKETEPDIEAARRAGLDVTEQVAELRQLQSQLAQLKAVYGSGRKK